MPDLLEVIIYSLWIAAISVLVWLAMEAAWDWHYRRKDKQ